jgi:hydroxyacylglutathione hydrolase
MELEDTYADVVAKSLSGLNIGDISAGRLAGVTPEEVQAARKGSFDVRVARALAPVLDCHPEALVELGEGRWSPAPQKLKGLHQENTPWGPGYPGMTVNAYLAWDAPSRTALIVDAGADASGLIALVRKYSLEVKAVFLTHRHPDHIGDLTRLREACGQPPVHISSKEPLPDCDLVDEGDVFRFADRLKIECRLTPGHSPGGLTYVLHGLGRTVAFVGDALFAGSMGGAPKAWNEAKTAVRKKILTLPPETLLCPGHGPLTTVAEELQHNPFFAVR